MDLILAALIDYAGLRSRNHHRWNLKSLRILWINI